MRIQTANRRMTALACGLSLLTLASFVLSNRFAEQRELALQRQLDTTLAAVELRRGSDLLTASVRAYAATGDERHREAFQTELQQTRRRERALETIRRAGEHREVLLAESAKRESDALLEFENRIFKLAGNGQYQQALALAYGSDYAQAKARIRADTDAAIAEIARRSASEVAAAQRKARWFDLLAAATLLLNSVAVLYMLLGYYKRRIVGPLTAISELLRRFDAGERALRFRDPAAAYELRELGEMLEAHADAVSELERQRLTLLLSDQQQRAIFDAATSGIALVKDRCIVDCNERLAKLLGRSRAGLIGQPTAPLFARAPETGEIGRVSEALESGRIYRGEQQLRRRDGQTFWARLSAQALDAARPERGSVWVIDDIGGEREASERMAQAQRLAEEAARSKTGFLVHMSQEIRTPMNAIIGMAHLLARTPLNVQQAGYLRQIDAAGQQLMSLLNDVLDLSKIEAGRVTLDAVEFDLERMCENVRSVTAADAAAKGLGLQLRIAPDLPAGLVGDPLRLSQVLLNYVGNAIKFTPAGQIDIVVSGERLDAGDWLLRFAVSDTGIGLSAEQCSRLFQQFEQADASTGRRFGGSGLGLSIAKSLASLMGGEVGVESRLGVGSTFWFTARLAVGGAAAGLPPIDGDHARWPGRRVLLVDDNEASRIVTRELLEGFALSVEVAADGVQALECVARRRYDLVLMGLHMPQMDGIEATRRIRQRAELKRLPIIAMTASALSQDRNRSLLAGMDDHIAKPIELPVLRQKLQRWLAPAAGGGGAALGASPAPPAAQADAAAGARAAGAAEPLIARLESAGLDTAMALHQLNGDLHAYLQLLQRFMPEQGQITAQIEAALDEGQLAGVIKQLNGFIAAAEALGARRVVKAAVALQLGLKAVPQVPIASHALLSRFAEELRSLDAQLGEALQAMVAEPRP
jgi:PAS domain S-box-containing protein